ncbi:DUF2273 domain-containing protein [Paenibacillus sp. 481]|uniref:DUF2273 domain-containing protein n=1 Tax=Paenibacillus sp. 481 TaxID=2835869 RepID=UPI001E54F4A2|nr:DUF2273 domain-containing protein [Paenibacillus sp. 481]UHA72880.1 DUF2273 domain-containing protein [Paenibacillus sp. 481]
MWKEMWESHGGRFVGIAAGMFFGLLYLIVGLWDMFVFALLVIIGYQVGKRKDLHLSSLIPWQRVGFWLSERWRWLK